MFRWYSRYFGKNILYHQNEQKELVLVENIIDAHRYLLICFDPGRSDLENIRFVMSKASEMKLSLASILLYSPKSEDEEEITDNTEDELQFDQMYSLKSTDITFLNRFCRRYHIRGSNTSKQLLMIDSANGRIFCSWDTDKSRVEPLPWVRPTLTDLLDPGIEVSSSDGRSINLRELNGHVLGLYFSAFWCPPCKAFTPQLAATYRDILNQEQKNKFEIIFVSCDRSESSFSKYRASMPWLSLNWHECILRNSLTEILQIRGIPTLVLIEKHNDEWKIINPDARTDVTEDPKAKLFPWRQEPVRILNERHAGKLHEFPAIILFLETDETSSNSLNYYWAEKLLETTVLREEFYENDHVLFFVAPDSDFTDSIKESINLLSEDENLSDDMASSFTLIGLDLASNQIAIYEDNSEIEDASSNQTSLTEESIYKFTCDFLMGQCEMKAIYPGQNDSLGQMPARTRSMSQI